MRPIIPAVVPPLSQESPFKRHYSPDTALRWA